jgi:hypothetical protein
MRSGLQRDPVLEIERMREPRQVNLDVVSPEEVTALVIEQSPPEYVAEARSKCGVREARHSEIADCRDDIAKIAVQPPRTAPLLAAWAATHCGERCCGGGDVL